MWVTMTFISYCGGNVKSLHVTCQGIVYFTSTLARLYLTNWLVGDVIIVQSIMNNHVALERIRVRGLTPFIVLSDNRIITMVGSPYCLMERKAYVNRIIAATWCVHGIRFSVKDTKT